MKNTLQKFLFVAIFGGTKDILYNKYYKVGNIILPCIKQNETAEYMKKEDLLKLLAFLSFFSLLLHGDALHSEILAGNYQRPFFRFPDVFPSGAPGSTFSRCPLSLGDNHINWSLVPGGYDLESVLSFRNEVAFLGEVSEDCGKPQTGRGGSSWFF